MWHCPPPSPMTRSVLEVAAAQFTAAVATALVSTLSRRLFPPWQGHLSGTIATPRPPSTDPTLALPLLAAAEVSTCTPWQGHSRHSVSVLARQLQHGSPSSMTRCDGDGEGQSGGLAGLSCLVAGGEPASCCLSPATADLCRARVREESGSGFRGPDQDSDGHRVLGLAQKKVALATEPAGEGRRQRGFVKGGRGHAGRSCRSPPPPQCSPSGACPGGERAEAAVVPTRIATGVASLGPCSAGTTGD